MAKANSLLCGVVDAAEVIGVSERFFHKLRHAEGFPKPVVLGTRHTMWKRKDLEAYVAALEPTETTRAEPTRLRQGREVVLSTVSASQEREAA